MSDNIKISLLVSLMGILFGVGILTTVFMVRSDRQRKYECVNDNHKASQYVKECSYKQSVCKCVDNAVSIFGCEEKHE